MTRSLTTADLYDIAVPEQPALSPDGSTVAYVLRTNPREVDAVRRQLWTVPVEGGPARALTHGTADTSPAWAPDGSQLAFLRSQDESPQIWVMPWGGGEPRSITALPLGAGAPVWSPDGARLAFTAPVDVAHGPADDAATRDRRRAAPLVADRLDYQLDGAGFLGTIRSHLHVVDLATGDCRQVTEGDWNAGDPAWSPDGSRLSFTAGTTTDADLTTHVPVHVIDVDEAGAVAVEVGLHDGYGGPAVWTADASALLVVGHVGDPTGHAGLLRVPLDGGPVIDLAASMDRNVMPGGPAYPGAFPQLTDAGRAVLYCIRDRGCTHLYKVDVDGGEPTALIVGEGRVVSGVSSHAGVAAVVLGTPTSFGEIVVVDLANGSETVLTAHGAALGERRPFERVSREFTISDGTTVQGWLMRRDDTSSPGPLLVDVHGGPHNAWSGAADDVHLFHHELVARGWTILLLNPRGSDGYGEKFFNGALGGWGVADADDFLQPIDELVAEGIADPARLALTGYSYGGYMTCYLTSRDTRFAAAVAGGVISDMTSFAGTSDTAHFLSLHEADALPWADPERFAAMSPLTQVDRVVTPTLVLHGAADIRCPVGQAEQWHTALREQGVPTRMVLYPGGSHLFIIDGPPSHRIDYNQRVVDWVEQYAGTAGTTRPARLDTAHWQRRLDVLAARHGVPGATLGILRVGGRDDVVEAAHGVLNARTGVSTTTDSLFQIGSMSKIWTATLVMQLVDEGRLDLDAPLVEVLPDLRLGDEDVTARVTMRHLLTHTSGIDGDVFTDTGRGDDCLERYVEALADTAQSHPLGATWSYCNSGFSLMGRVVEVLTGMTWDQAVRDRLATPLGLQHTMTLPEEVLLHRSAVGHLGTGADLAPAPVWMLPRSAGPAGLINSTVADVLSFARLHLLGGATPDGTSVLGQDGVDAMAAHHADLPDQHILGDSWGLGWIRFGWDGHRLIGHDGNTIGQASFLRLLPSHGIAVVLLTNGGGAANLYQDLFREIFAEIARVAMPHPLGPPAVPVDVDVSRHVGTYERAGSRIEVLVGADGPMLRLTVTGELADLVDQPAQELSLVAVDPTGNLFVVRDPASRTWIPTTFYTLPGGEPYLHFGARATPRVA